MASGKRPIPEHARRSIELSRSGAAGRTGDRRTRRIRDRSAQRRNAIEQSRRG